MKRLITILLIVTAFALVSCKDSVMSVNNPDKSGADLNLNTVENTIVFNDLGQNTSYTDFQGVGYPVNENGVLTCQQLNAGGYVPGDMPAIFHAFQAPNYGHNTIQSYNIAYEYTVKFRLTDDTQTIIDGLDSVNEPQGVILTNIFLAGEDVHGALMLMIFRTDGFPSSLAGLHENVILALNYDGESSGHVIAVADVGGITAVDPSVDPNNEEVSEAARGIHTATIRVHDDADETHGPSITVIINESEVIKYQNTGSSHSLSAGSWDSETLGYGIGRTVLGIDTSIEAYIFSGGAGVDVYNEAWNTAVWRPFTSGKVTSLVTAGVMFQIGKKESNAGSGGSGAPGTSQYKSPEIVSIDVKPYTTPAPEE